MIESCFNLRAIMNSGQVFRMYEWEEGVFDVFSADRHIRLRQETAVEQLMGRRGGESGTAGDRCYDASEMTAEERRYWQQYFDFDRDYGKIHRVLEENQGRYPKFLIESAMSHGDIRVLNQDLFEMLITFIISQQKQIPAIRKCVEALCERFGEEIGSEALCKGGGDRSLVRKNALRKEQPIRRFFAFPTAESLISQGPGGLEGLSLGYRERYIFESSERYLREGVSKERLKGATYEEAKEYLKSFSGVGEKVANCVCLFGLHMVDAFPVDTHVKDILFREFYHGGLPQEKLKDKDYRELVAASFAGMEDVKGILQQWMFAAEISG